MKKFLAAALVVLMLTVMAVSAFDIDLNPDVITDPKNNVDLSNVDGNLYITPTAGDPFFGTTGLELDASKVAKIVAYINYEDKDSGFFQIFFTTPDVSWSEGASFKSTIGDYDLDANGYAAMEFWTDESGDWDGTITGIRFDIHNDSEGNATIAKIEFQAEDGSVVYTAGINAAEAAAEAPAADAEAPAADAEAPAAAPAAQTADLAVVAIIALGAVAVAKKH